MTCAAVLSGAARWHVEEGEALDIAEALPDASVDAFIADPPYAMTGESSAWVGSRADKVRTIPQEIQFYEAWVREHLACWRRKLKPTGGIWLSCDMAAAMAIERACYRAGLRKPVVGIWDREIIGMGHLLRHVYECFCVVTMPAFERFLTDEPDVWRHRWNHTDRTTGHPAEKPIPLLARAVRLLVRPPGVVVDPFSGSGTTGVAALREGCRYLGVERDEDFARLQRERLAAEDRGTTVHAAREGQRTIFDLLPGDSGGAACTA